MLEQISALMLELEVWLEPGIGSDASERVARFIGGPILSDTKIMQNYVTTLGVANPVRLRHNFLLRSSQTSSFVAKTTELW